MISVLKFSRLLSNRAMSKYLVALSANKFSTSSKQQREPNSSSYRYSFKGSQSNGQSYSYSYLAYVAAAGVAGIFIGDHLALLFTIRNILEDSISFNFFCFFEAVSYQLYHSRVQCEEKKETDETVSEPGAVRSGLPTYTMKNLKEHGANAKSIWVCYKNGVYDITDFVMSHPGNL